MNEPLLLLGFFGMALLYASVGHGGATGYLALLALLRPTVPQQEASSTALMLNTLVAGLALVQFARAGHFPTRLATAFLLTSIPAAFLGGMLKVPAWLFHRLLLIGLLMAAVRLLVAASNPDSVALRSLPKPVAGAMGFMIGLASGIVGIGGGVFLSPLLVLMRWATPRDTAGVAASLVLFNSLAGLLARATLGTLTLGSLWLPMGAAIAGGLIGSYLGARQWMPIRLNRALALVLMVASGKLMLTLV